MDATRWAVVRRLFEAALDQPPGQRDTFVREATHGDETLRAEIEHLLVLHEEGERTESGTPPAADELFAALAHGAPLAPGASLGTWRLLRRLGAGGMGEVWEAEQAHPRRRAALKVMRLGRAARALRRFRDEIDALARLEHPGIARILEAGEHDAGDGAAPRLWYAMELVPDAKPITDWAAAQRLDWREAAALMRDVCAAVEHGHRNGVIHRDLKASNILVGPDGHPRVIDFGVARLTGEGPAELHGETQAGELVGTLATMAPEQLEGRADVRSDVYALGVVLHELLAGVPPYEVEGVGLAEAARRVREVTPSPPSAARAEVPVELDWITGRALEKDPERRYAGAAALSEDLRRLLEHEPVQAGAPGRLYRARKFVRRHRVGVGFAAVVVVLLVGGIAGTTKGLLEAIDARKDAEQREHEADVARGKEADARRDAELSLAESQAVTQFLVDVFGEADPESGGMDTRVVDALDSAERKITTFLVDHPRAERQLRNALGLLDFNLGRFAAADEQFSRALELDDPSPDAPDEVVARRSLVRGNRGTARVELGRLNEAEADLLAALAERRERFGATDPRTAVMTNSLGFVRHRQGRAAEAEELYVEALRGTQAALDAGGTKDKSDAALAVDLAREQSNYGSLLLEQMRLAEAEPLLTSALELVRTRLPPEHPLLATALNSLFGLRARQNQYDEAAAYIADVVTLRARRLPADHQDLLSARANLATLRYYQKRPNEALIQIEEVLTQRLKKDPPWRYDLVLGRCNQVTFLHEAGVGDEAVRALISRLLNAGVGEHGESLQAVTPIENLARNAEDWGLLPEALALLEEAARARARLQQPSEPDALVAVAFRARILAQLDCDDDARAALEAVQAAAAAVPRESPRFVALNHELASGWLAVGEIQRAEPLLVEEVNLIEASPRRGNLRPALQMLADLCDADGRPDDATQWRDRLAALSDH